MIEPIPVNHSDEVFISLLLGLAFLAFLVQQDSKIFLYYFKVTFSPKVQTFQEDSTQSSRNVGIGLDLFSLFSFFSLYYVVAKNQSDFSVLLVLGALFFFIWGKRLLIYLLSFVFDEEKLGSIHITQLYVNNRVTGIIVFPLAFIAYYTLPIISNLVVYLAFGFVVFQFLVRFFKLLLTSFRLTVFPFYISFMYLCALEILPVLMIYKFYGK